MKKLPVVVLRVAGQDQVRGIGQDLRLAARVDVDARNHLQRRGLDRGARPQAVDARCRAAGTRRRGRACTCSCRTWPSCRRRGRSNQCSRIDSGGDMFSTCGLRPALRRSDQLRQAGLGAQVGAAHVDAEHQVEALHRRRRRRRQADRAGVVDQDVDAAEARHRLRPPPRARWPRRGCRTAAPAPGRRRPRSRPRRCRSCPAASGSLSAVFAAIDDVGAVARRALGDRQADAARGAGDEQGLASQIRVLSAPCLLSQMCRKDPGSATCAAASASPQAR